MNSSLLSNAPLGGGAAKTSSKNVVTMMTHFHSSVDSKTDTDRSACMNLDWIAGFFDGEGSVSLQIYRKSDRRCGYGFTPRVLITQANGEILNEIQSRLQLGTVYGTHNPVSCMEIRALRQVKRFIRLFIKRSRLKKHQLELLSDAINLLELRERKILPKETILSLLEIAAQIRALNAKRHRPYTDLAIIRKRL